MTTREFDTAQAQAFAGRMVDVLNSAFLTLMISIGHRTGLFDAMTTLPPATSDAIARAAGLHERYVREWLAAMVTGRVVEYDPAGATYRLPPEHAVSLTRGAGMGNLASFAQFVPQFGAIEERMIECFRNGGGVPYSAYPRFQPIAAEGSAELFDVTLVDVSLPLVPGLVERLRAGIDVADVGCGQGHAINLMAQAFPNSRFTGYDLSEGGIAAARDEAAALGLANARFEVRDVAALGVTATFDFITAFDAIHDQARPRQVLRGIAEALRSDGVFLMADIAASSRLEENLDHPLGPLLYTFSCLHCMTVSLADGGEGLGTMWGHQKARELLAEAGFVHVGMKQAPENFNSYYYIAAKG